MSSTAPARPSPPGWPRAFPVAQAPNAPLLVAFAGRGLQALGRGRARRAGGVVYTVALTVWAGEEVLGGVNWLRRLLGVATLAWLLGSTTVARRTPRRTPASPAARAD